MWFSFSILLLLFTSFISALPHSESDELLNAVDELIDSTADDKISSLFENENYNDLSSNSDSQQIVSGSIPSDDSQAGMIANNLISTKLDSAISQGLYSLLTDGFVSLKSFVMNSDPSFLTVCLGPCPRPASCIELRGDAAYINLPSTQEVYIGDYVVKLGTNIVWQIES